MGEIERSSFSNSVNYTSELTDNKEVIEENDIAQKSLKESSELFSPEFRPQKIFFPTGTVKPESQITGSLKSIINRVRTLFNKKEAAAQKATERIDLSIATIGKHKSFAETSQTGPSLDLLTLDEDLFLSPQELKSKNIDYKKLSKQAFEKGLHKGMKDIDIPGLGTMKAVRFKGDTDEKPRYGKVSPTSALLGTEKELEKDRLMNTYYVAVNGENRAIIRSAKVDSKQRAKDFLQLLIDVRQEIIDKSKKEGHPLDENKFVLRVCSNQLNSPESERKIIETQHRELSALKATGIEIVHINTPSNRLYHLTTYLKTTPVVGTLAEKLYLKGEKQSKEQNLEGWGTYSKWLNEDVGGKHLIFLSKTKAIEDDVKTINNLNIKASENKLNKAELEELERTRSALKENLTFRYNELKKYEDYYSKFSDEEHQSTYRKTSLMRQVLGSQLGIKGAVMSRGKEMMMIQMLNKEFGITSAMNCKSGLDRTGFFYSLTVATAKETDSSISFKMADQWDETTKKINLAVANAPEGEDPIQKLVNEMTEIHASDSIEVTNRKLEEASRIAEVQKFRKDVLTSLISQGIPITLVSTGVIGIKWHSGLKENLIPLNFLPPYVAVGTGKNRRIIQLVEYDKQTGKPKGLTTAGHQLLTKFDAVRSA